ncbi:MAG: HD domain-containing phosphohydrolase, partial [Rhodothermales bacterium]
LTEQQNEELKDLNENLKQKVMERTWEVLRLNQQLEGSFMGAIQAMARLGEMHSQVIGSHAKRVAVLSVEIAKHLGVGGRDLTQIEIAATLHDIGKTVINPVILKKPYEQLDQAEQAVLREHPIQGEAIVRMVPNNDDAARFVRHHHEWFDGSGYPEERVAGEIPFGARIIAVANAYDKLLNSTTSFTSTTPQKAVHQVAQRAGSEFDPGIVEALRDVVREVESKLQNGYEVEIGLKDLKPGMVLSRELRHADGRLLAQKNHAVEPAQIALLRRLDAKEPLMQGIFVYRKWPRSGKRQEQRVETSAA